jgi:hypothetical protein
VTYSLEYEVDHEVKLYNVTGRSIPIVRRQEKGIDMSHLPAGVYFLELNFYGGSVMNKIIKR